MPIRIGIENNIEGRTLAWALDYPGCFAYGEDKTDALIRLPENLLRHEIWIKNHTEHSWVNFEDLDLRVVEEYTTFGLNENYERVPSGQGYEVNAWFIDDWRPLTQTEIDRALLIFRWQRDELLAGLSTIEQDILEMQRPGERWNIIGIAKHIANAELWYLHRLGLTTLDKGNLEKDLEPRLAQTAALIEANFPAFEGKVEVRGIAGEIWSYRKLLRRTLWHQRDHIEHIKKLVFD